MTIEEAIEHCKEQAAKLRTTGDYGCVECAAEHEQLAEWLAELKQRREAEIREKPKTEEEVKAGMNRYIDADKYEQELRQMIEIVRETGCVPGINGEIVLVKPLCTAYIKGLKAAITALTTYREHEEVKRPKTKADKIRQMTDEELAEELTSLITNALHSPTIFYGKATEEQITDANLKWIKQEVVE